MVVLVLGRLDLDLRLRLSLLLLLIGVELLHGLLAVDHLGCRLPRDAGDSRVSHPLADLLALQATSGR